MPRHTGYTPGTPCWIDHVGVDPTGAKEFYGAVLGWEFHREDTRGYHLIRSGGEIVGGLGPSPAGPRFGSSWTVYLAAPDLDATLACACDAGARTLLPAVPAGGNGRLALAADPLGAPFGLWEGARPEGVVLVDEPGALCGCVLRTPRPAESTTFYRGLFGTGNAAVESVMAGGPARWVPRLGAADPADVQRRFLAAGAHLVEPGVLADPWGAVFALTGARHPAATPA